MQIINWNPWVLKIFIYFISCANDEASMFFGIPINRGQLIRTIDRIAEDLKYPVEQMSIDKRDRYHKIKRRTLERYLSYMEEVAQLIKKKVTRKGLLITVNNYDYLSRLPLKELALLDSEEVAHIKTDNNTHEMQGNMRLQLARDHQKAYGDEAARAWCKMVGMSEEDIERALNPVRLPKELKQMLLGMNDGA